MRTFHFSIQFLILISMELLIAKRLIGKDKTKFFDDVDALIETAGYQSEVHVVETEDGFLLKVHRILPKQKSEPAKLNPVFCMHGLLGTAANYLVIGPKNSIRKLI